MILTLSNLYPRPDQPTRGLFNLQLFAALNRRVEVENVCLVPEWRPWRDAAIRRWVDPEPDGVSTTYLPVRYLPWVGRDIAARLYGRALDVLDACTPDGVEAVYGAWLYPDGVLAASLARRRGCPLWLMALGSDVHHHLASAARRRDVIAACAQAEGVVVVSRSLAVALREAGVAHAKLHVVPNGVDATRFFHASPEEARAGLPAAHRDAWSAEGATVLFVGNLVPVKGVDVLVQALAALPDATRLVLVGDGPERTRLTRLAARAGMADRVVFAGVRPHGEIAYWMQAADVLCLPSRSEGMPNVVIEALCCGLPVVASDVGACGELLADDGASRTVPVDDVQALGAALQSVLREPGDRFARAERSALQYSWDHMADALLALIAHAGGDRRCGVFGRMCAGMRVWECSEG